ncbi:MAG: SDR family NAD(P)-dependent oxidoreductase, partial [Clostridia bacterium]|nr:SDR family NAD(P)-dependent oxidoreductase [Clostridia bacterium]
MTRVAVVTGASSGIGREFVRLLVKEPLVDVVYAVARREERLIALKDELGEKVRPLAMDVLNENPLSFLQVGEELVWAVHSAGVGYSGACENLTVKQQTDTVDLNCKAAVSFLTASAEKMQSGGKIVCLASAAAFTPQP